MEVKFYDKKANGIKEIKNIEILWNMEKFFKIVFADKEGLQALLEPEYFPKNRYSIFAIRNDEN